MIMQQFNLNNLRGTWRENLVLSSYTSWHVGGAAQYFYQPRDLADLQQFLKVIPQDMPLFWLGAGSNVLIHDSGIKGVVVCVRGCLDRLQQMKDGNGTIMAEAGVPCARLLQLGVRLGMLDMVFLAGIPGTVGGALAMNAGAYGDNIWPHVSSVTTINRYGDLKVRAASEFNAAYRDVTGLAVNEWFVSSCLRFTASENAELTKERIRALLQKRRATQPLDKFNCGSVFRNPQGDYAARLIESCGLKGKRFGGAYVSEKHANFIINDGTATAQDIELLMEYIEDVVYKEYGIKLQREVRILG